MPMQRDFRVNDLSKEDREPFRYNGEEEGAFSLGEKILEEGTLKAMAVLMGYQEGKVLEVLKSFQSHKDGWQTFDIYGRPIGAEETNEKIYSRFRIQGESQLGSLESFLSQKHRILRLNQRSKLAIVSLFDLPDPLPNLVKAKVIEGLPVGFKEFVMGLDVKALIVRPGIVFWKLI